MLLGYQLVLLRETSFHFLSPFINENFRYFIVLFELCEYFIYIVSNVSIVYSLGSSTYIISSSDDLKNIPYASDLAWLLESHCFQSESTQSSFFALRTEGMV